jgi:hypothetical protein
MIFTLGKFVVMFTMMSLLVFLPRGNCQNPPADECSIFIDSNPSGAEVYLDSVRLDVRTPIRLDGLSEGYHVIRLEKEDLEGQKEITLQSNVIPRININLTTRLAVLVVTSEPAGAEVLIDEVPRGRTPFRYQAPGLRTYKIGVRSIGYLPEDREVELKDLGITEVHVLLQRYGEISIESKPSEAEIYIDEVFQGRTPQDFQLVQGKHTITLRRAGSYPFTQDIEIVADKPILMKAELLQERGLLTVLGLPIGCEVSLDGTSIGKAPVQRQVVTVGPHWLSYQAEGYEPLKEPIWISVDGQKETQITVNPRIKTRWRALWRSMICPGIGQMYSEQQFKGILFLSTSACCVAGTVLLHYQTRTAYDNYQIAHDRYAEEVTPFGIVAARQNMVNKHDILRKKVHNMNTLLTATAVVWVLNCIDQVLFSSTPWKGKVQTTTRLSFQETVNQTYVGAQLALHW